MPAYPLTGVARLLQWLGLCAMALATLPLVLRQLGLITGVGAGAPPSAVVGGLWIALAIVHASVFWWTTGRISREGRGWRIWVALSVQAVTWGGMFWLTGGGYHMARTQLVLGAAQLGLIMSVVPGFGLVLLLGMLQSLVGMRHYPFERMLFAYITLLVPYGFAVLLATHLMAREVLARAALVRKNDELRDMQVALAEKQRVDERLRISRELHDLVGHHLTALSLRLEVASHVVGDHARDHVQRCQRITRLLLKDVREVVSALRLAPPAVPRADLLSTLRGLTEGIARPRIHVQGGSHLDEIDPETEHILVRCVQEIITNGVRHSHAENLWIRVSRTGDRLSVYATDDGVGSRLIRWGNGLRGMAERVERVGGRLEVMSGPAEGFRLDLAFPLPGGTR